MPDEVDWNLGSIFAFRPVKPVVGLVPHPCLEQSPAACSDALYRRLTRRQAVAKGRWRRFGGCRIQGCRESNSRDRGLDYYGILVLFKHGIKRCSVKINRFDLLSWLGCK
jgi:hypothetical protein